MSKELREYHVRMWPVTAIDHSRIVRTKDDSVVAGGETVFYAERVEAPEGIDQVPIHSLKWQSGVIDPAKGANGVTCEAVIDAVIGRLRAYQETKFKCRENALMITHLEIARNFGMMRREERMRRGVLNTHNV